MKWTFNLDADAAIANGRAFSAVLKQNKVDLLAGSSALAGYVKAAGDLYGGSAYKSHRAAPKAPRAASSAPTPAPKAAPAPKVSLPQIGRMTGADSIKIETLAGGFQRLTVGANGAQASIIGTFANARSQFSATRGLVAKIEREQTSAARTKAREDEKRDKERQKRLEGIKDPLSAWKKTGNATTAFVGAAALGATTYLASIAMGYRGMGQLNRLAFQAQYNFRRLFVGVDPTPVVRAFDKLTQAFNPRSFMGGELSAIFTRTFNGLFALVERAQPYVTAFGEGMVLAFLHAEIAVLKARIALVPYEPMLRKIFSSTSMLKGAAVAGGIAFAGLAIYAAAAAAPILIVAASVVAVISAIDTLQKRLEKRKAIKAWNDRGTERNSFENREAQRTALPNGMTPAEAEAAKKAQAAYKASKAAPAQISAVPPDTGAAGQASGGAYGDGVESGILGRIPAVSAAGKALAKAGIGGFNAEAQIKSPSVVMRKQARFLGAGAELGIKDSAPGVQRAADDNLVPQLGGGGARGGGASSGPRELHVHLEVKGNFYGSRQALEALVREVIIDQMEDVAIALGTAI